jgi:DNA-binding SARP family transcriptional activator
MAEVVGSRSGRLGLVAPGPVPGTSWRLVIAADGHGILHPLGLELACAVDAGAVGATVGALCASKVPPAAAPVGQCAERSERPGVSVLGPVVVRWPAVVGTRRPTRRKLEEVVAYLATHPERPVPAERLRTAIWPLSEDERFGEVADSSFRATISRTRTALGMAASGRPYLPEAQDGCYQLDASFGCDWVDFAGLVDSARSAPAPEARALLGEALALVRGAPFADAPRGAFSWAWSEQLVSAIEVAVADAAERLADLAINAGDHATARWAAGKGLLVVPSRESLYRARMRAAFEAGDIDDVEQAWTEVRRAARGLGEAEEPQGETTALYERLRRAARPGANDVTADGARRLAPVP